MSDRENRREAIIQAAANLFFDQGYAATSVRQIAEAVGVTEAALYYHFKDGKRALLQAVVEMKTPDFVTVLDDAEQADSLHDLFVRFGGGMVRMSHRADEMRHLRWALAEFPKFSEEERAIIQRGQRCFHDGLARLVAQFIDDAALADHIAWVAICLSVGYVQLFVAPGVQSESELPSETLVEILAGTLACRYGQDSE